MIIDDSTLYIFRVNRSKTELDAKQVLIDRLISLGEIGLVMKYKQKILSLNNYDRSK